MRDPVGCPAPIVISTLVEMAAWPDSDDWATRFLWDEIERSFRKQGGVPYSVARWISRAASGNPEEVAAGLVADLRGHGAWD